MVSSLNSKSSLLFIVEGATTEPRIIRKICSIVGSHDFNIYSYKTSIYELYDELKVDKDLDLLMLLREKETDQSKKALFDHHYYRIYLIFDYDPHYQKFDHQKVIEMIRYFKDSSDQGKLFINYPMMESHRHLQLMPDRDFLNLTIKDIEIREYKQMVGDTSKYYDISKYNYDIVREMVAHHLIKYQFLLYGSKCLPEKEYFDHWSEEDDVRLACLQHDMLSRGLLYVLNTSIFYVVDIRPKTFFNTVFSNYNLE